MKKDLKQTIDLPATLSITSLQLHFTSFRNPPLSLYLCTFHKVGLPATNAK